MSAYDEELELDAYLAGLSPWEAFGDEIIHNEIAALIEKMKNQRARAAQQAVQLQNSLFNLRVVAAALSGAVPVTQGDESKDRTLH